MAKPKTLVDGVSSLSAPSELLTAKIAGPTSGLVTVQFLGGREGFLDMADARSAVWAEVLDSIRQNNQPAYVEIDPRSNVITALHCPIVVGVAAIHPTDSSEDVEVELVISHARHFLRKAHPDFKANLEILQDALKNKTKVVVTESHDGHEIIDVRPLEPSETGREK